MLINDRLMLAPNHIFLFLKIAHYLLQRLLKNPDLSFVVIDLLSLMILPPLVLLLGPLIDIDVSLQIHIDVSQLLDILLVEVNVAPLCDCQLIELLIFKVDVLLDFDYVAGRFLVSALFELLDTVFVLGLDSLPILRHLNLVVVLHFVDLVLKRHALSIPFEQLAFVNAHLFENILQTHVLLLLLLNLNITLLQLFLALLLNLAHLLVLLLLRLVQSPIRVLFRLLNPVLQLEHQLHIPGVLIGERLHKHLPVFNLGFELLDESEVVPPDPQDLLLLLLEEPLQLVQVV